jgi:hypothetical protein
MAGCLRSHVLVQHAPDFHADFVLLQRFLGAAANFPGNALELDFGGRQERIALSLTPLGKHRIVAGHQSLAWEVGRTDFG